MKSCARLPIRCVDRGLSGYNDRQYATEADAIEDAMALAESSGYTYQVIKVCGTAVCHKKAEWKGVE